MSSKTKNIQDKIGQTCAVMKDEAPHAHKESNDDKQCDK